jgi:1-acyl-sn-glycerol-3-phosphate acyltransferase
VTVPEGPIVREPIAITGIGCRFPGQAVSPQSFWRLLVDGVDAIRELPPDRFDLSEIYDSDPSVPGKIYSRWGAFVDGIDQFDPGFFGFSRREAIRIDPQHRMLLETAWEAFEDARLTAGRLAGSATGVFVGISTHDYPDIQAYPGNRALIDAHTNSGGATSIASNRISYVYDLRGPSFSVDTACSSSLVAAHLACQSLWNGECDLALVGGVQAVLTPEVTIGFSKASMLSPDGRCKAFAAEANGYVRGEGAGAIVLKPLSRALADGDHIYAVVRGSAINEDGRTNGMTVPSLAAQQAVLRDAYARSGVRPGDVHYVEAHGTGTVVGDPIEAEALGSVLACQRPAGEVLRIGSVKTNIGHLEAASGIAGLIKAVLALHHRYIPPSLHAKNPSPAIPFEELRVRVVGTGEAWPDAAPAFAGVNSFGFGGANAHIVLEAAPHADTRTNASGVATHHEPVGGDRTELLIVSAKSTTSLQSLARAYRDLLLAPDASPLADVAAAAALERTHHDYRLGVVGRDRDAVADNLDAFVNGESRADVVFGRAPHGEEPRIVFVFTGMGPPWWGMARSLLTAEPVFRSVIDECDRLFRRHATWSLVDELTADEAHSRVSGAELAPAANFAVQAGLVALWKAWGVTPSAVVGHSAGEIASAYAAGALDLEGAVRVAFYRGFLQQRASGLGGMLAAGDRLEVLQPLLDRYPGRVAVAAINSPTSVTLCGDHDAIAEIATVLEERRTFCRVMSVDVPYHSHYLDMIQDPTLEVLAGLRTGRPVIPIVSEVTGDWMRDEPFDAAYWWRNTREPVRFADAALRLIADGYTTFVEVGPHPVLAASLTECLKHAGVDGTCLPSLRRNEDDRRILLRTTAGLHARGVPVRWDRVLGRPGRRVDLPPYPWNKERVWFEGVKPEAVAPETRRDHTRILGSRVRAVQPHWETNLASPALAYIADHRIHDAIVFPGAAYVAMALDAAVDLGHHAPALEHVEFRRALFLPDDMCMRVQAVFDPASRDLSVHAQPDGDVDAPWVPHASCRLSTERATDSRARPALADVRARCATVLPRDVFYGELKRRGFTFGPRFEGLESIQTGDGEALGFVRLPDAYPVDVTGRVHPALFDAGLQVLIAAVASRQAPGERSPGFLPTHAARITSHAPIGASFWSHAVVTESTADGFAGSVAIFDDNGICLLEIDGLRAKTLESVHGDAPEDRGRDTYELRWEEKALAPQAATDVTDWSSPRAIAARAGAHADRLSAELGFAGYYHDLEPRLERIARAFFVTALIDLGVDLQPGARFGTAVLPDTTALAGARRREFDALLEALQAEGILRRDGDTAVVTGAPPFDDPLRLARDCRALYPSYESVLDVIVRCGEALPDVLRGRRAAPDVLFSGDAAGLMRTFYRDAPNCRLFNTLMADAVSTALETFPSGRDVRVLEAGAGTGGATHHLLARLRARGNCQFTFTDVSPLFVAAAQAEFGSSASTRYATLDLERDPRAQGFESNAFDIVCAANVVHATRDVAQSLAHLRSLLAPGGLLVLQEITRGPRWLDLVFGITDGWWAFDDPPLRKTRAILDADTWPRSLSTAGFEEPSIIVEHGDPVPGQSVLMARAPASTGAGRWLVMSDGGGVGPRVADALRRRGCGVSVVDAMGAAAMAADIHGVVHCGSFDIPGVDSRSVSPQVLSSQTRGAGALIELMQGCLANGRLPSRVAIVTGGAQPVDPATEIAVLAQSPLWGLGRVLLLEHPQTKPVLIDCSAAPSSEEIEALVRETLSDDGENEVALRGATRYVRRVARLDVDAPRGDLMAVAPADGRRYRAAVAISGSLDGVRLRETAARELEDDDIEIEVKAASLNFRDVMFTMGMLPPAAFDSMLSAGALGVDCAGVVSRVGKAVADVAPGDEVIALSPASLASHAITKDLVARKPQGMSFTDAAALPLAYVTAVYALDRIAQVQPGERVLIHSATGGVGLAALAVAERAGAEIFATAGSEAKRAYLRERGIRHVMDSRTLDFADQIRAVTGGHGVDVVLNSLAGDAIRAGLSALAPRGRFLEIGKADIYRRAELPLDAFRDNISFAAIQIDVLSNSNRPLLRDLLREVTRGIEDGSLPALPQQSVPARALSDGLRTLAQARHIGKVVVDFGGRGVPIESALEAPPLFKPDASYLIAGGRGGVGRALVEWAVERGARRLVLMSRSASAAEDDDAIAAMRARGAEIVFVDGDVTKAVDVERAVAIADVGTAPLKGVFHAAMVMDDCGFAELDDARFASVLAPKVEGGWNLHRATATRSLDHFVLFSSITSVYGNARQGSYAAANAFLDALAAYRHAQALPALSINFGVFAGVGYVAERQELTAFLARQGQSGLPVARAFAAMAALMQAHTVHAAVSDTNWRVWADWNPAAGNSPKFSLVVQARGEDESARPRESGRVVDQLVACPAESRGEEAARLLCRSVARILGAAPDRVEAGAPLTEMGMDSLMAVELGTVLRNDFAIEVPVVRLLKGVTVAELAAIVCARLHSGAVPAPPPVVARESGAPAMAVAEPAAADEPAAAPAASGAAPIGPIAVLDSRRRGQDMHLEVDPALAAWTPLQRVARGLVTTFTRTIASVRIDGAVNVPDRGGFVIAANHVSMWDAPVLLCAAERPVIMFAAEELRRRAFMDWTLHKIWNAIYLRRGEADLEALEQGVDVLRRGGRLGLSPEGHRSRSGLQAAHTGVAYLAYRAGVPTLPVAAYGQERIVESWRRLRRAPVQIRIGPPISAPTGEPTSEALRAYTERVMLAIARLLPREYRGRYTTAVDDSAEDIKEIA